MSRRLRGGFVAAMAWREGRTSVRRLRLLVISVAVGVAALVAIGSFTSLLRTSVRQQARVLMGGDLVLGSAQPFTSRAEALVAELAGAQSARVARVTRFGAMAWAEGGGTARLVQVIGVEPGYPFYGRVRTEPPGMWERLSEGGFALVDAALLETLQARPGDTLALGEARLPIAGAVADFPGDIGLRAALGPRVFIGTRDVPATGLLAPGARVRHEAYVQLPADEPPRRLVARYRPGLAAERVSLRSVLDDQAGSDSSLGRMGSYLGLVGLLALLLGGLGVGSATHSLIRRKLDSIALLRCLGATGAEVVAIELLQAVGLGLLGSVIGCGLGVLLQAALPRLLAGLLPVEVPFVVHGPSLLAGLVVGTWTATVFALLPLLKARLVVPLRLLRRTGPEPSGSRLDLPRAAAAAALGASVALICVAQARSVVEGLVFAAAAAAALLLLWCSALGLRALLRRGTGLGWSFAWKQGIANLYRPANQTGAVVVALGFGAFLLATLLLVEHNLLRDLDTGGERPNLALFDVQPDQREEVAAALAAAGGGGAQFVPIVPMRIAAVNGVPASQLLAASAARARGVRGGWALRREYRSTYRDGVLPAESVVGGRMWSPGEWKGRRPEGGPIPISIEAGLARELGVVEGDELVWDVQGLPVRSRIAVLREVQWARFEPNFFVVFPEGPLEAAPATFATLVRLEEGGARARLQRRIAQALPNVSVVDLAQLQQQVEALAARLAGIVRMMALASVAAGALVLLAALAGSRYERLREAALLKALGATRRQLLRIALAEHVGLGALAAASAVLLSLPAGWALMRYVFETSFAVPAAPLAVLAAAVAALAVAAGLWNASEVARRPPLAVLRAE